MAACAAMTEMVPIDFTNNNLWRGADFPALRQANGATTVMAAQAAIQGNTKTFIE